MRFAPLSLLALALTAACFDKGDDSGSSADGTDGADGAAASGDCGDSSYNPYAGTCVETFMADCFDPSGECEGVATATGDVTLEWANGANAVTTTDYSDVSNIQIRTVLTASNGTECAVGITTTNTGGCYSQTVYTRSSDGGTQTYCTQADGSVTVTCDDGSTVDVSSSQSSGAEQCQYGDAEACDVTVEY